jgi:hypothetical protein
MAYTRADVGRKNREQRSLTKTQTRVLQLLLCKCIYTGKIAEGLTRHIQGILRDKQSSWTVPIARSRLFYRVHVANTSNTLTGVYEAAVHHLPSSH